MIPRQQTFLNQNLQRLFVKFFHYVIGVLVHQGKNEICRISSNENYEQRRIDIQVIPKTFFVQDYTSKIKMFYTNKTSHGNIY